MTGSAQASRHQQTRRPRWCVPLRLVAGVQCTEAVLPPCALPVTPRLLTQLPPLLVVEGKL
jgi:hypothetical protein